MGSLAGCKSSDFAPEVDKESKAYKYLHSAEVQPFKSAVAGGRSDIDVATGRSYTPMSGAQLPQMARPVAVSSDLVLDDPNGLSDSGEKAGSWVGTLDIYWKLNWIRQELMMGNVPRVLPDVIAHQRRHIVRIRREGKHLAPDPGHYIPAGVTIEEVLDYADNAFKQLEDGLKHLEQENLLEASGIRALSVPWSASEAEITKQFQLQGLIKTEHATATADKEDEEGSSITVRRLHTPRSAPLTRQEEAVDLALKYARTYHASPEDVARRNFEAALRNIVNLRDLLHYQFHKPSVEGSSTMIPGLLHQEAGTLPPANPTAPVKESDDPFRKQGDTSPAVVDPFHTDSASH